MNSLFDFIMPFPLIQPHVFVDGYYWWPASSPVHSVWIPSPKVCCVLTSIYFVYYLGNFSSGYQPSTTNQSLMTGSSSSNQQPLTGPSSLMQSATTGLNPQMMSSLNPATLSVMTAFPSQPMTGQLSGPASYNQPLMTGATSLPQQPPYYYQTPIASMQQPQPSLLH